MTTIRACFSFLSGVSTYQNAHNIPLYQMRMTAKSCPTNHDSSLAHQADKTYYQSYDFTQDVLSTACRYLYLDTVLYRSATRTNTQNSISLK